MRKYKKELILVFVISIIFLNFSIMVFAISDFKSFYEAYNFEKGDENISYILIDNPPEAIEFTPIRYTRYRKDVIEKYDMNKSEVQKPLNLEPFVLKKGESIKFSIDYKIPTQTLKSDVEFMYLKSDDPRRLFEIKHESIYRTINLRIKERLENPEPSNYIDIYNYKDTSLGSLDLNDNDGNIYDDPLIYIPLGKGGVGNVGYVIFKITGVSLDTNIGIFNINTDASSQIGEKDFTMPTAVLIGLTSILAASIGASLSNYSNESSKKLNEKDGNSYKMVIYKEFGDTIKFNDKPVHIYSRIVEVTKSGEEINRTDLNENIEIFSKDNFLEIGDNQISGDYLGASVNAYIENDENYPKEGSISFKFVGESGSFQNNVKFKMIGKEYISLKDSNLYVLATSKNSFKMPYELKDFLNEAKASIKSMQKEVPFDLKLEKDKEGNRYIVASDLATKKPIEKFFDSFPCEIIAENDDEYAKTVFNVVMCYEGILPDFLGKSKEIKGFKNEKDHMEKTKIAFKVGLWDESKNKLEFYKPDNLEITLEDEKDIFEVIGMDYSINTEREINDSILYDFKAEIPFPSLDSIEGLLKVSCSLNGKDFSSETKIELLPDKLEYKENYEQAYKDCLYIINTYLPERFRERKIKELEKYRENFGIKDLEIFRKKVWEIAQRAILQEKEQYLIESYWYDEAIAQAELVVAVGDIAFEIAIASVGGPLAGFAASQAKSTFIELISLYIEKPSIGMDEFMRFLERRFVQMIGQSDGAFNTPKPNEYKKLVAWLSCYIVYRIIYHKYYDTDKSNNPIGYVEAVKRGIYDMSGKSLSILISDYVKKSNFESSPTLKASNKMGEKYQNTQDVVIDFIKKIKNGGIEFN